MAVKKTAPWLLLLLLIAAAGYRAGVKYVWAPGDIAAGIRVKDVSIGGMNKQQAREKLIALQNKMMTIPVTITYKDQCWPLPLREVGLKIDTEETLRRAMNIGHRGSFIECMRLRHRIRKEGYVLAPVLTVDLKSLTAVVERLAGHLNVPAKSAAFAIDDNDRVIITPSQNGQCIDMKQLKLKLEQELLVKEQINLPLTIREVAPEYTTEDIQEMGITGLLSSYTTAFDPALVNRAYNIRVAANALDGLLVVPGEEVSFNEVVGPRSSEAGYKEAGVIVDNEMVKGLGGGVCQVSTTLYNAVLLADIEVVERKNHSLPVSYVPIGRDATVVYGAVDLKFQNNTGRCLYFKTEVSSGQITVKIFGDVSRKKKVVVNSWIEKELEPRVTYEEDENLKKGQEVVKQEGSKGYIARTERLVIENGRVIRRDELPASRYNPVDKIIAVGTAEREPVVTPPAEMVINKKH
ncbi:vancomycin resistance protein YoaR [Desulfohalotomaculum tongense]|uniref:VanW family protein n=1 Tax=Desulforadius tongensis TaxID=1216062 RepID=UPI00195C059C|nr:VanW family protein [Desulforadius tongensis]MBM7855028.1 vancomycin resistance protein YoaR [Desulforadius tongensis]